jgi:hypothetical protein
VPAPLLQTKLYIPPPRPELISHPPLMERLNAGLPRPSDGLARQSDNQGCLIFARKLTLVSALAGFGKITPVRVVRPSTD